MSFYRRLPLVARILIGALIGIGVGYGLGPQAKALQPVSDIVLQLLRLLSTPLVFFCVVYALVTTDVSGRTAGRLTWLVISNTAVAALIGLGVANLLRPGGSIRLPVDEPVIKHRAFDPVADLLGHIPKDFATPFLSNDMIAVILVGFALGIGLRAMKGTEHEARIEAIGGYLKLARDLTIRLLHWLFELIPFAVLAVVAQVVGKGGLGALSGMVAFVLVTVAGLLVLLGFYILRLQFGSWVKPLPFLRGSSDALALAFSTASSAATLPVTYDCAVEKLGVKEQTAGLGVLVGGALSHDGGALYQAVAALFVAQATGHSLDIAQQMVVVGMAILAGLTVAGIPSGGLVVMFAVFSAVRLPVECIPLLLPLDWLLDRCRTAMNVCGDLVATCLLEGRSRVTLR